MAGQTFRFVTRAEQLRLRGQRNYSRYMLIVKGFVAGDSLERAQWQKEYAEESVRTPSGAIAMGQFPVVQGFFSGDTILKQHGKSRVGLLTTSEWASGRALTPMTVDQQRDGVSMPLPAVDWELYRRLKAEGRLNLLFHFSEAAAAGVQCAEAPTSRSKLLPFVSRAEHLAWRARWKNGRWVKLSWTPEQRAAILRQDEAYRLADIRWAERHGPVLGGAIIALFSQGPLGLTARDASGSPCHAENVAHDDESKL